MTDEKGNNWSIRMPMIVGMMGLFLLVGVIGTWSVMARLSGAVVSSGVLEVEYNRQVIQHRDGGVVEAILVHDGDHVKAGDVVIRLKNQIIVAELKVVESQFFETLARKARFQAERDGTNLLAPSQNLRQEAGGDPIVHAMLDGQARLFMSRTESFHEQLSLLAEEAAQVENQVDGIEAQLSALREHLSLVETELANSRTLFDKGVIEATRLTAQVKEKVQVAGEIGSLTSEVARLRREKTASEIKAVALGTVRVQEAISELRELEQLEIELAERRSTLLQTLDGLDIKAPVDGVIYGSTVFALNAVIGAAEPVMYVVPQGQNLIITARIATTDVDQVSLGQATTLRFSAFDAKEAPELNGSVSQISADAFLDDMTGALFYNTRISVSQSELDRLDGRPLLPGMPVEVFIKTSEKSPLEYLTKPFADYFSKAFRES